MRRFADRQENRKTARFPNQCIQAWFDFTVHMGLVITGWIHLLPHPGKTELSLRNLCVDDSGLDNDASHTIRI